MLWNTFIPGNTPVQHHRQRLSSIPTEEDIDRSVISAVLPVCSQPLHRQDLITVDHPICSQLPSKTVVAVWDDCSVLPLFIQWIEPSEDHFDFSLWAISTRSILNSLTHRHYMEVVYVGYLLCWYWNIWCQDWWKMELLHPTLFHVNILTR